MGRKMRVPFLGNAGTKRKTAFYLANERNKPLVTGENFAILRVSVAPRRFTVRFCPARVHTGSVVRDWRRPLGSEKSDVYLVCLGRLENTYSMFSVNLDEAIGLRRYGRTAKAHQVLSVAPALCQRLAQPLQSLLRAMLEHAKHFGTTPNLAPLDPENFQNARSQRVARFNDLLSNILLTRKSRFLHKISSLADLVDELDSNFASTVEELAGEESFQPERDWELLDAVHYDLNTCLREAVVLFKSFLHALPEAQLASFQAALEARSDALSDLIAARSRHLAHRRMAFLKGQ
jgi:hypothetical protein